MIIFLYFLSGLLLLESFVEILDKILYDISVVVVKWMMFNFLGFVNDVYEVF